MRDADLLPLYRRAGVIRFLLGIESYDAATLSAIRKGADMSEDAQAIRLLRQHGIVSMATCVIGFEEERDRDYGRTLARLLWQGDVDFRHAMRWYTRIGRRVWFHEVAQFLFDTRLLKPGPTLREFLGPSLAAREYALARPRPQGVSVRMPRFIGVIDRR